MYNEGISKLGDLIDVAVENGIITKSGSWFTFKEERVQGRDGMRRLLTENQPLFGELEQDVRASLHMPTAAAKPAADKKSKE
jgi:recombination protein RecA